jgi:uncharacterized protein YkwD
MDHGMTGIRPNLALALAAALLLALAATLLASPLTTTAAGASSACNRWGDTRPAQLTTRHARAAVLCLVNKQRRSNGRGGLNRNDRLNRSARRHSKTMASKGCFSHRCSGERSLGGRLRRVGYLHGGLSAWGYGENIAWGTSSQGTPRSVVRRWMGSSGHRASILSRSFKDFGAGFALRGGSAGFYTVDFGFRRG